MRLIPKAFAKPQPRRSEATEPTDPAAHEAEAEAEKPPRNVAWRLAGAGMLGALGVAMAPDTPPSAPLERVLSAQATSGMSSGLQLAVAQALRTGAWVIDRHPAMSPHEAQDLATKLSPEPILQSVLLAFMATDPEWSGPALKRIGMLDEADRAKEIARIVDEHVRLEHVLASGALTDGVNAHDLALIQALNELKNDPQLLPIHKKVRDLMLSAPWKDADATQRAALIKQVIRDKGNHIATTINGRLPEKTVSFTTTSKSCGAGLATAFYIRPSQPLLVGCNTEIVIDGTPRQSVSMVYAQNADAAAIVKLAEIVGEALVRLPPDLRRFAREIVINPTENPDDVDTRKRPGFSPDHVSAASAMALTGTVHVYPATASKTTVEEIMYVFAHEFTHLLDPMVRANPALMELVTAAGAANELRASSYAFANDAEFLAESMMFYIRAQNSPRFETYRALMPVTFQAMEAILVAMPNLLRVAQPPALM